MATQAEGLNEESCRTDKVRGGEGDILEGYYHRAGGKTGLPAWWSQRLLAWEWTGHARRTLRATIAVIGSDDRRPITEPSPHLPGSACSEVPLRQNSAPL